MRSWLALVCAAAAPRISAVKPSSLLGTVGKDNFMNALMKEEGWHDPVTINKYSRLSTQIRQYVAHDVFDSFRGLDGRAEGCHDRSLGCTAFAGLEQIWGYGCHCYFGSAWKKARGEPVNEVDELCSDLNMCYRCIVIDANDEGEMCNPAYQNYSIPARKDMLEKGITHACFDANHGNACAQRTCCCDTQLTDSIINFFFQGVAFDASKQHAQGFDPLTECGTRNGPTCAHQNCELKCCGDYPSRYTYKAGAHGNKQCCGDTLYNAMTKQCCADSGQIIDVAGTC